MTGIGAFVVAVAVITVSVLSSSCVTSNPVGLRTSRSGDNDCTITDCINKFSDQFHDLRCENVNTA